MKEDKTDLFARHWRRRQLLFIVLSEPRHDSRSPPQASCIVDMVIQRVDIFFALRYKSLMIPMPNSVIRKNVREPASEGRTLSCAEFIKASTAS